MASILAPVLYLIIVVGGLGIFSSLYRKRSANRKLEPYFPSHPERDAYVTLLGLTNPPAPDSLLKAALIQRACADVRRVIRLRDDKPAAQALLQKGSIGDDLWNAILAAEKETEAEILEVMHEANSFMNGWGQFIFNSAGEMVQNEKVRKMLEEYPKMRAEAESKYGSKKVRVNKSTSTETPLTVKVETVAPKTEQRSPTPQHSQPQPPANAPQPVTSTSNGSLAPPTVGADGDSVASMSDGEIISVPSSPGKPSKKSGKKGKKRK